MQNDGLPTTLNLSIVANKENILEIELEPTGTEGIGLLNYTFSGEVRSEKGESWAIEGWVVEGKDNELRVRIPAIPEGRHEYAVYATSQAGEAVAFLSGKIGAWWGAIPNTEEAINTPNMRCTVQLPGVGSKGVAHWLLTTRLELAAERAEEAAERAEDWAETAEDWANDANGAYKNALQVLQNAQAFMTSFNQALYDCIKIVDNYLYIGNYPTGHYLRGDDGITPHIGTDGYWYLGVKKLVKAEGEDGLTPYITSTGYWAIGDKITNVRAQGRDGLDGTAIRMILVDSYDDIPQSGETCNGGFRYLVKNLGWTVIGDPDVTDNGEWEAWEMPSYMLPSEFTHLRVPGVLNENTVPVYLMVRIANGPVLGVSQNAATWAVGDVVTWEFATPIKVPNRATIQIFLRKSSEGTTDSVPFEEVLLKSLVGTGSCRVRYRSVWYDGRVPYFRAFGDGGAESYDYYAWVEHDNDAGWVRIDKNNELATAQIYGLMKYATDMTVEGGAPVGKNAAGQASVPIASAAVPGSVLPSSIETEKSGGYVHVDEDGKVWVDMADPSNAGAVKLSYSAECENTNSIGRTSDNKIVVPRAAAFQWGVSKIGTTIPQSQGMPWIIPVGMAAQGVHNEYGQDITGQLLNNVLKGGALRTYTKGGWQNNPPPGIDVSLMPDNSNAVGISTSDQFQQETGNGLVLRPATTTRLAGVYLGSGVDDERTTAVTTTATTREVRDQLLSDINTLRNYVNENFYTKPEVYNTTQTHSYVTNRLTDYATMAWSNNMHYTKAEVEQKIAVKVTGYNGIKGIHALQLSEMGNVSSFVQGDLYFIYV